MIVRASLLVVALALIAPSALPAAEDHEMLAAQQELKIAKDHLRDAGTDYAGHKRAAMDAIDKALQEIRLGLEARGTGRPAPGAKEQKGGGAADADED